MDVGFVGLGAMGGPMARRLVSAGHRVTVSSRSRGPIDDALAVGMVDGGDPAGVVTASRITVVCVPDSPDVAGVLDAILPVLGPGRIVVDCSTIDPAVEREQHRRVAETGAKYLEAPVSGGPPGATAGTLTLMVGGDEATLDDARPALDPFAGRIVHCGGPGFGQTVKLANNLLAAAQMAATAEATALALKAGVDPAKLYEVLVHSSGDCFCVRTRLPVAGVVPDSPASHNYQGGFKTDLMNKDVGLALAAAAASDVPMPVTAIVRSLLTAASSSGFGEQDYSAVAKIVIGQAGLPT